MVDISNIASYRYSNDTVTILFNGNPKSDKFHPIIDGCSDVVRWYLPGWQITEGNWMPLEPHPLQSISLLTIGVDIPIYLKLIAPN
ncbi:hypothetical protein Pla110_07790 [Polystyrenella longa]|uniref:Uncharacterized protein n=1 Tax=Polystyrenella longa TaxID=2528007 RepID=A0A518CIL6_9PLAN|nr:hypothetical protein Pla110_07790 [Polystyrenella longa]